MVKEYLEKIKQEFVEQKLIIQRDILGCQNRMKENAKFIEILEDTNDPNYDAFTPRETNSFNRKKIVELNENQKMESTHLCSLQDELQIVENKIDEITNVINEMAMDSYHQNSMDFIVDQMRSNDRWMKQLSQNVNQQMGNIFEQLKHHMSLCMKFAEVDPERTKLELMEISKLFETEEKWIENFSYTLYPSYDDVNSFEQKVQHLIEHLQQKEHLTYDYHINGTPYRLDNVIQITILSAIRELSRNVKQHSGVSNVCLNITYELNDILLNISDTGHGFDYESLIHDSSYGVLKMGLYLLKNRIRLLRGKMDVESALQKGCSIKIHIPKL